MRYRTPFSDGLALRRELEALRERREPPSVASHGLRAQRAWWTVSHAAWRTASSKSATPPITAAVSMAPPSAAAAPPPPPAPVPSAPVPGAGAVGRVPSAGHRPGAGAVGAGAAGAGAAGAGAAAPACRHPASAARRRAAALAPGSVTEAGIGGETMLSRPESGRKRAGMPHHVRRPLDAALRHEGSRTCGRGRPRAGGKTPRTLRTRTGRRRTSVVARGGTPCRREADARRAQGSVPLMPIPPLGVMATTHDKGTRRGDSDAILPTS